MKSNTTVGLVSGKPTPPILQPYAYCQWNSMTTDKGFNWEFGGSVKLKNGFGPAYVLIAPEHVLLATIGLRSENCRRGFDYLYLRAGGLVACNLPLDPDITTFIFVDKDSGNTTRSLVSIHKDHFTNDALALMIGRMHEEASPSTIGEIKTYITTHKGLECQKKVPLKPYEKHRLVYRGLKLGEFLSDYVDADPELLNHLERKSKCPLPDEYRSFILETNGGHLKNQVFFHAKGMRKPRRLVSFKRFDAKSMFSPHRAHFGTDPRGFLNIAADETGREIFLGLDASIHGRVYWVAPKASEAFFGNRSLSPDKRAGLAGVCLLGESFSSFIEGLVVTDELV